ncbi:ETX/MTX2 family pore-forming toxin [Kitasatospora sp. NPDC056076]|uniref:ETX/MTX2 family pore-forming toxin n=1 Tax=Kitasatospora sp. NPDC056076 TaxID=3345703 RepID=UPI0035DDF2C8
MDIELILGSGLPDRFGSYRYLAIRHPSRGWDKKPRPNMNDYLGKMIVDYVHDKMGIDEALINVGEFLKYAHVDILGDATLSPPVIIPNKGSQQIYSQDYTNGTSVEQSQTLKFSKNLTRTVTTTKTKTFEVSEEVSVEVGLEGIGKMGGKITVKAGQTNTESETNSVSESWSVDNPIKVPAHKTVQCVVFVEEGELSVDFECQGIISLKSPDGKQTALGPLLQYVLDKHPDRKALYGVDLGDASAPDSPRYRMSGDKLVGRAKGKLTAKVGVNVKTVTSEPKNGKVLKTSYIDVPSPAEDDLKYFLANAKLTS